MIIVEIIIEILLELLVPAILAVLLFPGFVYGWAKGEDPFEKGNPILISTIFWLIATGIIYVIYILTNIPEV